MYSLGGGEDWMGWVCVKVIYIKNMSTPLHLTIDLIKSLKDFLIVN